jgi:alpha-glucuronidase
VANIGTDRNWTRLTTSARRTGTPSAARLGPPLGSDAIADEWIRMTFGNDAALVEPVVGMMLASREAAVDYMTPLGLHHLMARRPPLRARPMGRATPRAPTGPRSTTTAPTRAASASIAPPPAAPRWRESFGRLEEVPEEYLLWFHRVGWDHRTASGRTLWDELVHRYHRGVEKVRRMQDTWRSLEGRVDVERFEQVRAFLAIQEKEARWWRDACILYFQTFSKRPFPEGYERPARSLEHYRAIQSRYVPGI